MEATYELIADTSTRQIGCVLIQASAGCSYNLVHQFGFDASCWATAPRPGMRRISGTREEWERFAAICNEAHSRKTQCKGVPR